MARATWSGSIAFGLVNVPIKVYTARQSKTVTFNQLSSKTGARVRQKRVDESTGDEIAYGDIIKGYEITPGRYITVEADELDALKAKGTRSIELEKFVPLASIDPIYYNATYYLGPDEAGVNAYRLLAAAMRETEMVGVGKVVMRGKQYIAAIRASDDGVLVLSTLHFGDEVLPAAGYVPDDGEVSEREQKMGMMLIEQLSGDFDPGEFTDDHRAKVLELIEAKASGQTIETPSADEAPAQAPDLMAALEASLAGAADEKPAAKKPPRKPRSKPGSKAAV